MPRSASAAAWEEKNRSPESPDDVARPLSRRTTLATLMPGAPKMLLLHDGFDSAREPNMNRRN